LSSRPWLVGLLAALPCAACGAPTAGALRAAITNGAADADDPAVVAILDATGTVECSGTVIAPHAVLTAAHCMVDASSFDRFTVSFGATATAAGAFVLTDAQPHPMFDRETLANDLALVTLLEAAPAAPLALDAQPVDATRVGQSFTAVGFGETGPSASDSGAKRSGTATVTAVDPLDFTSAPSPSQPCGGDSGGPALFQDGGAAVLTGVVSHGDTGCADHAVFARIDVAQANFIQPYLAAIAGAGAATGGRCYVDDECASGPCLQALDEPKRFFCSQPCKHDADCPKAMSCASDGCRYAAPSPGALGARCAQPGDCASGICFQGACTRSCVAIGTDCPSGYDCTNTTDITFYCLAAKQSGCAIGGDGDGSWLVILLLLGVAQSLFSRRCSMRSMFSR
jgi:hypothetical protein